MVLNKEVMGFYPNWLSSDLYLSLNYDSLTTIAWSFLGLQSNGSLIKESYPPTNLINYAHSKGKKVVVSINPGWGSPVIDDILASQQSQTNLIQNILNELITQNFDGVDIDLEGFPSTNTVNGQSNRTLFTTFIINLSNTLRDYNLNYWISIDIPPTDWENVFDTNALKNYVTYFMLMGYDYHWASGPTAGAVAPLPSVTNSIDTYLQSIPTNKLLLGVPYYGYEWQTQTDQPDSPVVGSGISYRYSQIITNSYPKQWNSAWSSPYYVYYTAQAGGKWHQGWYDNVESLTLKYDVVKQKNLAGIGIWALGYDTPQTELSDLILSKFSDVQQQYHKICQNNICTQVTGPGTNECQIIGNQCVPTPTQTYNCINYQCAEAPQGTTGQYSDLLSCQQLCTPFPSLQQCTADDINLFGVCVPRNAYVYGTFGMIMLLMIMR